MKVVNFALDKNAGVELTGPFQINIREDAIRINPVIPTKTDLIDFPGRIKQASAATIGQSVSDVNKISNIDWDIAQRKISCQYFFGENQKKVLINILTNDKY